MEDNTSIDLYDIREDVNYVLADIEKLDFLIASDFSSAEEKRIISNMLFDYVRRVEERVKNLNAILTEQIKLQREGANNGR